MLATFLARHDPSAPALITSRGQVLTYRELRQSAHRATCALREHGLAEGRIVAITVSDPAAAMIAVLGALETGATTLVMDPRAGEATRAELLERAKPAAILSEAGLDGEIQLDLTEDGRFLPLEAALLIYTSGSCGEPKGVLLTAEAVLANLEAILGYLPVVEHPRTAIVLPLAYSYALIGQALVTLRAGGTLLMLQDLGYTAMQLEAMARHGAQGLSAVPTSLRLLAEAASQRGEHPPFGYLASAGSALDASTLAAVQAAFPGVPVFNQYGLTEACPRVTAIASTDPAFARGTVGRALPGMHVVAVDEAGTVLPPGETGELRISSPSLMEGYLDDPEGTERVMGPEGLLSGDLGHVDAEGYVFVTGRRDGLVKIGGERVSTDEVASYLNRQEGVREACVLALPDPRLGARLVAFVAGEGDVETIAREAARALPPAKRPARVIVVETLPRNARDKIDGLALRALVEQASLVRDQA